MRRSFCVWARCDCNAAWVTVSPAQVCLYLDWTFCFFTLHLPSYRPHHFLTPGQVTWSHRLTLQLVSTVIPRCWISTRNDWKLQSDSGAILRDERDLKKKKKSVYSVRCDQKQSWTVNFLWLDHVLSTRHCDLKRCLLCLPGMNKSGSEPFFLNYAHPPHHRHVY